MSGTTNYYNRLGNSTRLVVLSFTPPATEGLKWIEVWEDDTVFVERQRVSERGPGIYKYFYCLKASAAGKSYYVRYLDENLASTSSLPTEQYVPPVIAPSQSAFNPVAYTTELIERHYTVLEMSGQQAILLRKKTSGSICVCKDDETRQPRHRCPECYGTGWTGGYDVFSPFLFRFQPAGEQVRMTEVGLALEQQPRGWTAIAPEVHDGDVIVRLNNRLYDRFQVTSPSRSWPDGSAGIPTIQEFSVKALKETDAVYSFPVEAYVASYGQPSSQPGLPERGI